LGVRNPPDLPLYLGGILSLSSNSTDSLPKKLFEFSKKAWAEIYKIEWPHRDEVIRQVIFLVVVVALLSVFFLAADFVVFKLVHYFFSLFQK
jgi:preprotein translocase SecE subunit